MKFMLSPGNLREGGTLMTVFAAWKKMKNAWIIQAQAGGRRQEGELLMRGRLLTSKLKLSSTFQTQKSDTVFRWGCATIYPFSSKFLFFELDDDFTVDKVESLTDDVKKEIIEDDNEFHIMNLP